MMMHRPPNRPAARDLERYSSLFAGRTAVMKSSAMRDLMAIVARPEVISLAGGLPDTSTFPAEELAKVLSHMAAGQSAAVLQYAPTEGLPAVHDAIAEVMAAEGMHVDPDEVLVTTGGQQVIDLACKILLDPGDLVVCEAPTYPGAVPTFASYEAQVRQIPIDDDGMRVDLLEEELERLDREGVRPKFIYTIPTFQNPGGVTMSLPRRQRLISIARERELLVLEDNPYGLLRFDDGDPLPTLFSMDGGEFVVYVGTFSKILSPGIRLGWAAGPRPVLQKMNIGKAASDLCSSSMSQLFVAEYFATGRWPEYMRVTKELYRRRRDVMLEALEEHFPPEATWTKPGGGLFLWATLPESIDTTDLLAKALGRNVAFVPGRAAYLDGRGGASMRLNFSAVPEERIREGVRRIGGIVAEQLELIGMLTGSGAAAPERVEASEADAAPDNVLPMPPRDAGDERRRGGHTQ